jgi:hypothetical protein
MGLVKLENICINCFGELKADYNSSRFCSSKCSSRYSARRWNKENSTYANEWRRKRDGAKKRHVPKMFESTKESQQQAFNDFPKGGRSLFDRFAYAIRFIGKSNTVHLGSLEDLYILDKQLDN